MTPIAERDGRGITSRAVPEPMRHRNFRLEEATWRDAVRIAELRDERISDVMRDMVRGYVRKHRKLLESAEAGHSADAPPE